MRKFWAIIFVILYLFFWGQSICFAKISKTELISMQQYTYDLKDVNLVMRSAIGVLQDSDFVIEDFEPDLGFLRATKIFKSRYTSKKRVVGWSAALAAATAYTVFSYGSAAASMYSPTRRVANELKDKTIIVDVNVFVEPCGEKTKVKFIPVAKVLQNADGFSFVKANPMKVLRIYDKRVYNEFFAQIGQNLD